MPGIEFVDSDAGGAAEDDVLDTGPRRPWPRWFWAVVGVLVAAAVISVLVSSRSEDKPAARPSVSPTTTPAPSSDQAGPVAQIVALTSDGTSLYWIAGNRLFRAGPVGRASASVAISPTGGDFAELQLVADPAVRTIWVVSRGSSDSNLGSGTVQGFATTDLRMITSAVAPSLINGAAVLNGALYVLSSDRLLRTTVDEHRFVKIATVDPRARGLAAATDGLLFTEGSNAGAIGRWTPNSGVRPPVVLNLTDSSLAVVGDTVFVAGTRNGRDVLSTLKPAGPRAELQAVPTGLDAGLQLVAAGSRSVIVLGTDRTGLRLVCVRSGTADASGVSVVTSTPAVSANVAVLRGLIFEAVGGSVQEADLGRCPG